jgi:hypothetical protein
VSPLVLAPLGPGRFLVADQPGLIYVTDADGKLADRPFLDLRPRITPLKDGFDERGLLGLALHPRYGQNRRFYVVYSAPLRPNAPPDWDSTLHLSEFTTDSKDPTRADPASERILLEIDKPHFNHNGGRLVFGPDGYLYLGIGDGGAANGVGKGHSPKGNSQDPQTLLGKIVRLDIDRGEPYQIPADNPLLDKDGRPEIWAWGIRNPWGLSFDRGGGRELFAADVGQESFEEVNIIQRGGNYGWNLREGLAGFDPAHPTQPPAPAPKVSADGQPLLDPIIVYKNRNRFQKDADAYGLSVTGGYVYRGSALPALAGRYVFADWSTSWVKAEGTLLVATRPATADGARWSVTPLALRSHPQAHVGAFIVAFAEDEAGELYVLTNGSATLTGRSGKIFKLVPM